MTLLILFIVLNALNVIIQTVKSLCTVKCGKTVVPSSLKDFTDEGRQQNNCVGHYYHKSIAEGLNLIYFIRKTNSPDKSYITNRFNIHYQKTTETKKKNNATNDDQDALRFICRIDEMIRTLI